MQKTNNAARRRPPQKTRKRKQKKAPLDNIIFGIKVFMVLFLVFYVGKVYGMGQAKDIPVDDISSAMEEQMTGLTRGDSNTLKRKLSVSADDVDGYLMYSADNLMDVSELIIVKAKDESQLPGIADAAEAYLAGQKEKFDGYGTNQYELLDHAVVEQRGKFLFCAVSENAKQWEEVFLSCVE